MIGGKGLPHSAVVGSQHSGEAFVHPLEWRGMAGESTSPEKMYRKIYMLKSGCYMQAKPCITRMSVLVLPSSFCDYTDKRVTFV